MQRLEPLVHRQRIGDVACVGEQAGVADRKRDFEQLRVLAEPVGAGAAMREVGAEFAGEIGARNNAYVDFVAELGEDTGRRPPDAVSARFVDARAHSDIGFDAVRKVDELFAFELDWQVAGIGVLIGNLLDQRRIVPGLQVGADLASAGAMQVADELEGFGRAADRKIEDEGRPHAISFEDPLRTTLRFDRGDTPCPARPGRLPVELGFGIDDDDQHRRLLGRPVDRLPGIRVEHASTVWFNSLRLLRLRVFRSRAAQALGGSAEGSKKTHNGNGAITLQPQLCQIPRPTSRRKLAA